MSKDKNPTKKSNKPEKEKESKAVKFKRVCTPRLRKALKAIKLIGNCSTKDYAYTGEQVSVILIALDNACKTLQKQFSGTAEHETAIEL